MTSMIAKEKDPYNPKDANWLDHFREDYAFKLSTVIESGATAYMMVDRFQNKKSTLGMNKNDMPADIDPNTLNPDYLGTLGNVVFLGGVRNAFWRFCRFS